MTNTLLSLAAAALLAAAVPAQAASLIGVATAGPVVADDYSDDGLVSFDLDFLALTSATLSYRIDAADLGGGAGVAFNAILRNLAGSGVGSYLFTLDNGIFDTVGTVTRQFGGGSLVGFSGNRAIVSFTPPEFLDVEIGDPLGAAGGRIDWAIGGLAAGDRLGITVSAVPEPGSHALMLSGLAAVGWLLRRRRPA